jgi:nucleoside-diphosphate-sugar epimerase
MVADVAELGAARRMVEGMDVVVLCHMASRQAGAYETTELPFDVNVKGTAHLLSAAVAAGVQRVVLVSSVAAVNGNPADRYRSRDIPLRGDDLYSLTKALQERIVEHYHRLHDLPAAVLRPAWVVDAEELQTKYETDVRHFDTGLIDRRDIGEAIRLCCELPDLDHEVLYLAGPEEADGEMDVPYTRRRLGWEPKYRFAELSGK